jgi:hypothetical protein
VALIFLLMIDQSLDAYNTPDLTEPSNLFADHQQKRLGCSQRAEREILVQKSGALRLVA